jgi:hypothetical protein
VAFGGARGLPDARAIHFVMPGYNARQLVEMVSFVSTRGAARDTPALLMTEDFVLRWTHAADCWTLEALAAGVALGDIADRIGFAIDADQDVATLDAPPAEAIRLLAEIDPLDLRALDFVSDRASQLDAIGAIYDAESKRIGASVVPGKRGMVGAP